GGVVVQLPQLFEMRIKLLGGGCRFCLRQSEPWIGGRKRQQFNIERRRCGTSMRRGPDYIQHAEVPRPDCPGIHTTARPIRPTTLSYSGDWPNLFRACYAAASSPYSTER